MPKLTTNNVITVGIGSQYDYNAEINPAVQIQRAYNYAAQNQFGLYIKSGIYIFSLSTDRLFFDKDCVVQCEVGTIFRATASLHPGGSDSFGRYGILTIGKTQSTLINYLRIDNLTIDCNRQFKTAGLTIDSGDNFTTGVMGLDTVVLNNVKVINFGQTLPAGTNPTPTEVVESGVLFISGKTQSFGSRGYINKIVCNDCTFSNSVRDGFIIFGGDHKTILLNNTNVSDNYQNGGKAISYDTVTTINVLRFYQCTFERNMRNIRATSQAHFRDETQVGFNHFSSVRCRYERSLNAWNATAQEYALTPYWGKSCIIENNYIGEDLDGFSIGASIAGTYNQQFSLEKVLIERNIFDKCRSTFDEDSTIFAKVNNNIFYKIKTSNIWGAYSRHFPSEFSNNMIYNPLANETIDSVPANQYKWSAIRLSMDGCVVKNNYIVDDRQILTPITAPTLTQVVGGGLLARTYFVKYSWVSDTGETLVSSESSLSIAANSLINVNINVGPVPTGAIAANIYISTTSNTNTLQGSITLPNTNITFTEPVTGLVTGISIPTSNTTSTKIKYGIYELSSSAFTTLNLNVYQDNHFIGVVNPVFFATTFKRVHKDNMVDNTQIGGLAYNLSEYSTLISAATGTIVLDNTNGLNYKIQAIGNVTIGSIQAGSFIGEKASITFVQDVTGNRTLTLPNTILVQSLFDPILTANQASRISLTFDGTNWVESGRFGAGTAQSTNLSLATASSTVLGINTSNQTNGGIVIPEASTTQAGIITSNAQTFFGIKRIERASAGLRSFAHRITGEVEDRMAFFQDGIYFSDGTTSNVFDTRLQRIASKTFGISGNLNFTDNTQYGLAVNRLTTAQKTALTGLNNGEVVYDTGLNQFQLRQNGSWVGTGTGTVTNVASTTTDLSIATGTTTPSLTINSAPKLTTARTINGTSFDGSANITVVDTTKLLKAGDTITGDIANTSTGYLQIPQGTTAQRPATPLNGMRRYNTDTSRDELYANASWQNHARLAGDTFTGAITATNLTGTNTGDQTITLTGDVTGTGAGAFVTAIGALKVLGSMIANATVDLATKVTGILPIANGGTGSASQNFVDLTTAQTINGIKGSNSNDTFFGTGVSNANSSFVDIGNLGDLINVYFDARSTNLADVNFYIRPKGAGRLYVTKKLVKNYVPRTATVAGAITANDEKVIGNSASAITLTLDSTSTFGYEEISVKNIGAGIVTIATTTAQTIDAGTTITLSQYQSVTLTRYLTNWIVI